MKKHGQGRTVFVAFPLGGSYRLTEYENTQKLLVTLADMAGIQPDAKLETTKSTKEC